MSQKLRQYEKIFNDYANVPLIARKSIGITYRSMTKAQRLAYVKVFRRYMARLYGTKYLKRFVGTKIKIIGTKK